MSRKTKLKINSFSSLLFQIVAITCGFILPRFFLTYYGSEVNGLVSSITQFLGFITLAECGVGAVVQSTLYKPLAEKDILEISKIVVSSERFFRRIALLLVAYTIGLMFIYPLIVQESFDYFFTSFLIFAIAINTFAQYCLGMTYRLVLNADQLGFVQYIIHTISLIVNMVFSIVLMYHGASIHIVKLATSLIFALQPILLTLIAKRRYKLNQKIELTEEPIKQKWNGLAQHIAGVVLVNTDTAILTLFATLKDVSVYSIYYLVVNGIRQIILSITNGLRAMFGNMIAKNEEEELKTSFEYIEWAFHLLITFVFSVTAVLIVPFVKIYTKEISDSNYIVPGFAYMLTLAQAVYCYRLPYYILVNAAGHYKQTQWSAIIEATINILISVIMVFRFGLIGVAIGTFAAMAYRTIYLANYLKNNILYRDIRHFIKHIVVDICEAVCLLGLVFLFPSFYIMSQINYIAWGVLAVKVGLTGFIVMLLVNSLFYRERMRQSLLKYWKKAT